MLAAAAVYLLTLPKIAEPIMDFCFAGIVPGTGTVIAPDVMLMGVTVIVGLLVSSLLLLWVVRHARVRNAYQSAAGTIPAHAVPAQTVKATPPAVKPVSPTGSGSRLVKGMERIRSDMSDVARRVTSTILLAIAAVIVVVDMVAKAATAYGKKAWIWLKPHITRLDGWLELRYRAGTKFMADKLGRYDRLHLVGAMLRESIRNLRQLLRSPRA